MHRTPSANAHQQRRINPYRSKFDSIHCFNLLTDDALFDQVELLLPDHRERLYPPTETLSMFLAQTMGSDRSCQQIVNQAVVQRLLGGLSASSTHTGGYCRARQRIPLEMIQQLTHYVSDWVVDLQDEEQLHTLLVLMAQQRVGNRPGRIEPRVVKRRPKQYSSLRKPRHIARQLVLKYGHPKKLK